MSFIAEIRSIGRITPLFEVFVVEICRTGISVMGNDKLLYHTRKVGLLSYGKAVGNMPDDVLGTVRRRKPLVVMRPESLVLNEAQRIGCLAYIMVQRAGTHKKHIGTDCTGSGIGHIHNLKRMLESARSLVGKFPEQLVVGIAQLYQTRIGHKRENTLKKIYQRISGHGEERPETQIKQRLVVIEPFHSGYEPEHEEGRQQRQEHKERRHELLPPLMEISE